MKLTNNKNLPQEFVNAIKLYKPDPDRMSVTHLIDEPLIRTLQIEKWDEIVVDASDYVLMMLGISFHKQMENESDEHSERKYEDLIDGIALVGKADLYRPKTQSIEDYKVTSVWTIIFGDRIKEWEKQLNVYCYQYRSRGLPVAKLQIHCILRDWSETRAQREDDYPKNNFVTINIPIWSIEEQMEYIEQQLEFHRMCPKGECSPESKWQKETKWAVMKEGRKSALRVLDTEEDAIKWCELKGYGKVINNSITLGKDLSAKIVERPGECTRCLKYCAVRSVCEFAGG